jgi:hypothetical protein
MIEHKIGNRQHIQFDVGREPLELLYQLAKLGYVDMAQVDLDSLFPNRRFNTKTGIETSFWPEQIKSDLIRRDLEEMARAYGYTWPARQALRVKGPERVRVVIASLDNLPILEQQVALFQRDPLVDEIVAVNNGSIDGTKEYLDHLGCSTVIHRDGRKEPEIQTFNRKGKRLVAVHWAKTVGAGPVRNSGVDVPGEWDFAQFLDGGILPLEDGTERLLDYLQSTPQAHVIGVEIADFRTDIFTAWKRWYPPITRTYRHYRLSHTAYALARRTAFDGIRFSEEGPFFEAGWGADDDEMMCRWLEAGIHVHVVTCACKLGLACSGVHPFRRASGSWARILRDTGCGATAYGSTYESRCVLLGQEWPQYEHNNQWGEPWITAIIKAGEPRTTAQMIQATHDTLRQRRFQHPWSNVWNPYSVVVWANGSHNADLDQWLDMHRLRQHHGTAARIDDRLVHKNGDLWTGDFRVWQGDDWQGAVREGAYYYGLAQNPDELEALLSRYDELWPPKMRKNPPPPVREEIRVG